jgi:peptidoglycan hydrolase-like protein with peptidoglycan-binding domain
MKITKNILREMIEAEMKEAPDVGPDRSPTKFSPRTGDSEDEKLLEDYLMGGDKVIQRGSRGKEVKALQRAIIERLKQYEFQTEIDAMGAVDGIFGGGTRKAVLKLQEKYGITEDGAVGRQTWTAIKTDGKEEAKSSNVRSSSAVDNTSAQEAVPDRPSDLGTAFQWNDKLGVWWAKGDHTYNNVVYTLWIRKGKVDYHSTNKFKDIENGDFGRDRTNAREVSESTLMTEELVLLIPAFGAKAAGDTNAIDMIDVPEAEEPEADELVKSSEESVLEDNVDVSDFKEIKDLIKLTKLGNWTEKEFAKSFEDWIIDGFSGNDVLNEFKYIQETFDNKLDKLLSTDFTLGRTELSEDQKKTFIEELGSSVLDLKPNQLTKEALEDFLEKSKVFYNKGKVEEAWNLFTGKKGSEGLDTSLKLRKDANDKEGERFFYYGHEEFITLIAAMKKLSKMKADLVGFKKVEPLSESFSFDRFIKLAGLLKS